MSDVFISYKSTDRDRVRQLVEVFEAQGWEVWWDRDISVGEDWGESIEAALQQARCVVVVWSESSVAGDTDWVFSEAEAGRKASKLVPLMLDPVEPPKPFNRVQTADLSDWVPGTGHQGLETVVAGVARILESGIDRRKLPRPGFPVAHAVVAAAGLTATAGPMIYLARAGPPSTVRYFLLALIAVAAGAAAFSLIRGLFPWGILGFRSFRNLKPPVAAAASILIAVSASFVGFLLGSGGTPVEILFQDPREEGGCPGELEGVEARLELGQGPTEALTIGDGCRARARISPAPAATDTASISLDPGGGFVVADPFEEHFLVERPVVVEVARGDRTPRARLSLLDYRGVEGAESLRAFDQFRGVLEDKLATLKEQLRAQPEIAGKEVAKAQLDALELEQAAGEGPGSDLERSDFLARTHSLGLLSGTVLDVGDVEIKSRIFVSDPASSGSSLPFTTRIAGAEFNQARDGHAAAFVYAMAMEARRLDAPKDLVMAYLGQAFELAKKPESEEADMLRKKIEAAIDEIRNGGTEG